MHAQQRPTMTINWTHVGPTVLAAFLASMVEFVEALTVVLAVGIVRGWRSALLGSGVALAVLLLIVVTVGPALTRIPLDTVKLVVGALLLLFGMRWLRKAILRAAGVIALHDEGAIFAQQSRALSKNGRIGAGWDSVAFAATFKITMLEGIEVVFVVIALGAGDVGLLLPASVGALAALIVVATLGFAIHRPLARVPENQLKFLVGVLISAFGTFWVGEGLGFPWPHHDWSILFLMVGFLVAALIAVPMCGASARRAPRSQ